METASLVDGAEHDVPTAAASSRSGDELTAGLLAAAVEVFTERGFDKAGVAEIARRAGVTTGAIYARWSGKHDLMLDAVDLVVSDELEALLSVGTRPVTDILGALGGQLLVRSSAADQLIAESFVIARRDPDFGAMLHRRMADEESRLAAVIDGGKQAGLIDPALSTAAVVRLCQVISIGFAMLGSIDREPPAADGWNAVIDRLITAALPADAVTSTGPTDPPPSHEEHH